MVVRQSGRRRGDGMKMRGGAPGKERPGSLPRVQRRADPDVRRRDRARNFRGDGRDRARGDHHAHRTRKHRHVGGALRAGNHRRRQAGRRAAVALGAHQLRDAERGKERETKNRFSYRTIVVFIRTNGWCVRTSGVMRRVRVRLDVCYSRANAPISY